MGEPHPKLFPVPPCPVCGRRPPYLKGVEVEDEYHHGCALVCDVCHTVSLVRESGARELATRDDFATTDKDFLALLLATVNDLRAKAREARNA